MNACNFHLVCHKRETLLHFLRESNSQHQDSETTNAAPSWGGTPPSLVGYGKFAILHGLPSQGWCVEAVERAPACNTPSAAFRSRRPQSTSASSSTSHYEAVFARQPSQRKRWCLDCTCRSHQGCCVSERRAVSSHRKRHQSAQVSHNEAADDAFSLTGLHPGLQPRADALGHARLC